MTKCWHCGLSLDPDGHCPANLDKLPTYEGREYGTAQQLAHRLGRDVTTGMILRWRDNHGLANHDGLSYYDEAAAIEAKVAASKRGRPRRLDETLVAA